MPKRRTKRQWDTILLKWRESGLSLAEFARRENINYWTIWDKKQKSNPAISKKQKESKQTASEKALPEFVSVNLVSDSTDNANKAYSSMEILLRTGRILRIDNRCQMEFLAEVVSTLEVC